LPTGKLETLLLELELEGVFQCVAKSRKNLKKVLSQYKDSPNRYEFVEDLKLNCPFPPEDKIEIDSSFIGWSKRFAPAAAMYRHPPVFRLSGEKIDLTDEDSYKVSIAPLHPLPENSSWKEILSFDPLISFPMHSNNWKDFATLKNLLRFEGRPPKVYDAPKYEKSDNARYNGTLALPLFARLDFNAMPAVLQPKDILIAWLNARGIQVNSGDRSSLLEKVNRRIELGKEVCHPSIVPKDKPYSGFEVIKKVNRNDKYDN